MSPWLALSLSICRLFVVCLTKDVIVLIGDYNGPIYQVNETGGTSSVVYRDSTGVENIAYDPVLEHVYWSNINLGRINRVGLDGSNFTLITYSSRCQGLEVDPLARLLFHTDDGARTVSKFNMMTRKSIVLARVSGSSRPHDITVDTKEKQIYWSVIGSLPKIETADYNGNGRKTLMRGGDTPTSISLDSTAKTLFWCDEHGDNFHLYAIDLATRTSDPVNYTPKGNLYDLDLLNTTLYAVDREQPGFYYRIPESGGQKVAVSTLSGMYNYRHIHAFTYPYDCPIGKYGRECELFCGKCKTLPCLRLSGKCPLGCEDGLNSPTCPKECREGDRSPACTLQPCVKTDGSCPLRCNSGWTGLACDTECPDGQYGAGCRGRCGQCGDGVRCDSVSGLCVTGCALGWAGATCHTACEAGTYGADCEGRCGQCAGNVTCSRVDGTCDGGCQAGWTGYTCDTECEAGFYGRNCSDECGHCVINSTCRRSDGRCLSGCQSGWDGHTCSINTTAAGGNCTGSRCSSYSSKPTSGRGFPVVAVGVSIPVVALVLFLAGFAAVIYIRRRRRMSEAQPTKVKQKPPTIVYSVMRGMEDDPLTSHPGPENPRVESRYPDIEDEVDADTEALIESI